MTRIFLHDEFDPETVAMLQALYSRSADSVERHVEQVRTRGSAKFMASYYVGYGHASIGDCGTTTLFLEGISILAAKAIQDTALFSGQETSTRYIDFTDQPLVDPIGTAESQAYLRRWIDYYEELIPQVQAALRDRFPRSADVAERTWGKAIEARAFDIMRGFLPAGATTQTSWTTSLRHAHEHLARLSHHPLEEVRSLAAQSRDLLRERYPSSFGHMTASADEAFLAAAAQADAYLDPATVPQIPEGFEYRTDIDNDELERIAGDLIAERPKRAALPRFLAELGTYRCTFPIDFGSFRDLQRHRNGICRMPLLTDDLGFHSWYIDQLPAEVREGARDFVDRQLAEFRRLRTAHRLDRATAQYLLPIGMTILCRLTYDLPQMVYVAELRSGQTVHPTLRAIAQQMAGALAHEHPRLALYADASPSEFCVRRGDQDIVRRETVEPASEPVSPS